MSDLVAPTGRVHWIGTGLSTGTGLAILCDQADSVTLWARTDLRAEQCLARLGLSGQAGSRTYDLSALTAELRPGDVVVSMLPATEHLPLLTACLATKAHFACSSYTSPEISALAPKLTETGVAAVTEAGLDPGIDHLLAHQLVSQATAAVGNLPATATFTSYCGGIPAVPNEFRYRFSWAPRSVLSALRASARYLDHGTERVVDRPWEAVQPHVLDGEEFEVYPNRDSIPFIDRYAIPPTWKLDTFVRGTLRLGGWHAAWQPVFDVLSGDDLDQINALADDLARRYPTTDADRDRVVLSVALSLRTEETTWSGEYLLDMTGDAQDSAMARTVSTTLARGTLDVLHGLIPPGLHEPGADRAAAWLAFLADHGVRCAFRQP